MNHESKELAPQVELTVIPPDDAYGWRLEYTATSDQEAKAYNGAIKSVFRQAKLIPYETTGHNNEADDSAGRHVWSADPTHRAQITSVDQLEKLLPLIHLRAQEFLDLAP